MAWEDSVFPGWASIVKEAVEKLEAKGAKIVQVKEKFGGLRIYVDRHDDEINSIIEQAEWASEKICEFCGDPGKQVTINHWLHNVCPNHDTLEKIQQFRLKNNC